MSATDKRSASASLHRKRESDGSHKMDPPNWRERRYSKNSTYLFMRLMKELCWRDSGCKKVDLWCLIQSEFQPFSRLRRRSWSKIVMPPREAEVFDISWRFEFCFRLIFGNFILCTCVINCIQRLNWIWIIQILLWQWFLLSFLRTCYLIWRRISVLCPRTKFFNKAYDISTNFLR